MTKPTAPTQSTSPFFNLLADADEIQIRELVPTEESVKSRPTFSGDGASTVRSFVVHIRNADTPTPAPAADYDHSQLALSAELLLENGDYVLARNIYSYLLNINLRDQQALKGLGICLFHLADRVSARKCFKAWFELYQAGEALVWMGKSFAADADWNSALTAFNQVPDRSALPEKARFELLRSMGTCHARIGQLGPAEDCYRGALQISAESQSHADQLWVNLGSLELQKGRPEMAEKSFAQALVQNPKCSKAFCGLGLSAIAARNPTLACAFFHKALELDSENWLALEQWGHLFTPDMDPTRLQAHLNRLIEVQPRNADVLALAAEVHLKLGQNSDAEKTLARALEIDPAHVRGLLVKGRLTMVIA